MGWRDLSDLVILLINAIFNSLVDLLFEGKKGARSIQRIVEWRKVLDIDGNGLKD